MLSSFLYAVSGGRQLLKIYIFGWRGGKRREAYPSHFIFLRTGCCAREGIVREDWPIREDKEGESGESGQKQGKVFKKEAGVDYPESSGDGKKEYGKSEIEKWILVGIYFLFEAFSCQGAPGPGLAHLAL
ncbi:small nuclear ribonucleoprotein Lsm8 [Histoplasma capsulatum var. duboisii H88]|uniref:Small nuclear ribonucleoprotein Lsm8 n=1 Tax=Ajellomyces capsulatus (strain H88) TaxID=544711 RepID=A0A8A1L9W8_AJEC8|nr:small nuclear ribonucleoprotein Lsm8 [Histoplasma capsulatum var. duboisii H88]